MIRFRHTIVVAAMAVAISIPASYAQAQRGRGGRGGRADRAVLPAALVDPAASVARSSAWPSFRPSRRS